MCAYSHVHVFDWPLLHTLVSFFNVVLICPDIMYYAYTCISKAYVNVFIDIVSGILLLPHHFIFTVISSSIYADYMYSYLNKL